MPFYCNHQEGVTTPPFDNVPSTKNVSEKLWQEGRETQEDAGDIKSIHHLKFFISLTTHCWKIIKKDSFYKILCSYTNQKIMYYGKTEFTIACKNGHDDIVIIVPIWGLDETFLRWFSTTLTYVLSFQKNIRIEAGRMPSCFLFRVKIVLDHYGIGHVQRLRKMVAVGALGVSNTG